MPHVAASCFIMIPTPRREELKEVTAFPARMGYTECIESHTGGPSVSSSTPRPTPRYVKYSASPSLEPPYTLLSFPFLSLPKPPLCTLDP
ncbi:hypothetical protein BDW42DRAFT_189052 [Aspergillus taichungensis]|uniref:Uncharacterized protein n=1 Tax=Aspergillus taichungensis TaxID=482145 RepID=A0A2J5HFT7_9EURO|nr:hypothetical protein BDW42DRAFT_189052 [Aspergillus taichungensis]